MIPFQDTFEQRVYQMLNDKAVPMNGTGGGTASINGNDAIGQIHIHTGSHPEPGSLIHVTFSTPYKVQPFVQLTPEDVPPPPEWFATVDWSGWDIIVPAAAKPNTDYAWTYRVDARPWSWFLGPNGQPTGLDGKTPSQY